MSATLTRLDETHNVDCNSGCVSGHCKLHDGSKALVQARSTCVILFRYRFDPWSKNHVSYNRQKPHQLKNRAKPQAAEHSVRGGNRGFPGSRPASEALSHPTCCAPRPDTYISQRAGRSRGIPDSTLPRKPCLTLQAVTLSQTPHQPSLLITTPSLQPAGHCCHHPLGPGTTHDTSALGVGLQCKDKRRK
jgi:hypothetical protein